MDDDQGGRPGLVERLVAELETLEDGAPTFACVAAKLVVSHRTLRRRLKAEGTSYSKLLAMVRLEAARRCLANDNLTIDEIAYQLGYTEPTNFRHAFRRWTGQPPSAYRAG
ncbi:helix-turn-helix transcriptional regulator [Phenylobacterium sp.]|uniref:helix-turn-helix transcriptional regulator n=1 Tax=Phenylobacterium sp. TaxID=1871053 RepID=UPI00286B15FE|nr:helix-turn-helix transcriptional regulator [Phenylobacterium sp.]